MNFAFKDHLDNVRATFSDLKLKAGGSFVLELLGVSNYYPFGMQQPGRNWAYSNMVSVIRFHLMTYIDLFKVLKSPDSDWLDLTNKTKEQLALFDV